MKHQIKDWTGKVKYDGRQFDSLEEASGFLNEDQRTRNPTATDSELAVILDEFYIDPIIESPLTPRIVERLLYLSGASSVMYELLVENKALLEMLQLHKTNKACLDFINENY